MTPTQKQAMENTPFPISLSCVDMIVLIKESQKLVLIRKHGDDHLRLPGGFVDTTDLTLIAAAKREMCEEIHLYNVDKYKSHGSFLVHDVGRYEMSLSKHRLRTNLFSFEVSEDDTEGIGPGDDASEVVRVDVELLNDIAWANTFILPTHIPLLYMWFATLQK